MAKEKSVQEIPVHNNKKDWIAELIEKEVAKALALIYGSLHLQRPHSTP